MKIGHHEIDTLPIESTMNEEVCTTRKFVSRCRTFEGPYSGGANCNNSLGRANLSHDLFVDCVVLGMHFVIKRIIGLYWLESIKTDN